MAHTKITTRNITDDAVTSAKLDTNIDIAGTLDVTGATTLDAALTVDTTTLVVDASNNRVGIGTASPDSPLEISSSDDTRMKITDTGDSSELMLRSDGANTQIYTNTAHDLGIYTSGNVGQLHLKQSNGNVGIGATPSNAKLEVVATSGEVFRADANSGAFRIVANQTGVNMQGTSSLAGTLEINGLSNYTGLTVKGSGASRPMIQWSNVNQGYLGAIYGTEGQAIVIGTGNSSTTGIQVDSSQNVTTPGQPSFNAYNPAQTSSGSTVVFGTERHDTGGDYNASTGIFTAPVAGVYSFHMHILMDPGNNQYGRVLFRINDSGSSMEQYGDNLTYVAGQPAYVGLSMSIILYMAANDNLRVHNSGEWPTYGTAYGCFSGHLLG